MLSRPDRQSRIRTRLANANEASLVAAVLRKAFLQYESLYTAKAFAVTTPNSGEIEKRWKEGPVWVAIQGDRLVGTVAATAKSRALYIRSMAIVPSARRQGIGRILLEEVENFAKAAGFQRMLLSTTPFLYDAIRLYERFGFEKTTAGPHDLEGTPLFTMEKALE
jgi:ribosomal protein S18 acetylase RimI-like enzyme